MTSQDCQGNTTSAMDRQQQMQYASLFSSGHHAKALEMIEDRPDGRW